jgi:hypothetical protein
MSEIEYAKSADVLTFHALGFDEPLISAVVLVSLDWLLQRHEYPRLADLPNSAGLRILCVISANSNEEILPILHCSLCTCKVAA